MAAAPAIPQPVKQFFSKFPLHTYEPQDSPFRARPIQAPTLWIQPPRKTDTDTNLLSSDVECLKWQAYLALRGLKDVQVRWDVHPSGGVDGRLPNLHTPMTEGEDGGGVLLAAHLIPEWVDKQLGQIGELEGYVDEAARDESRAWVSLLEGNVHAALSIFEPHEFSLLSLLAPFVLNTRPIESVVSPPPPPLTGLGSLLPARGTHVDRTGLELRYKEAIGSLSERLGTDKWFLGSSEPTALDALVFAYLHVTLHSKDHTLRFEVTRRVNLVAWERRVQGEVRAAFIPYRR